MKVFFVNANLYGHINPTLALVKCLRQRGNSVDYFCAEVFRAQVENVGARWIGYSDEVEKFLKEYRPTDRHPFYMLMEYMLSYDEALIPQLLGCIERGSYDMIICDSYFGAGCFLKKLIDIPVVCSHSSFAMSHTPVPARMLVPGFHPQLDHCNSIIERICLRYGIAQPSLEEVFISRGELNVVYTTASFNADAGVGAPQYLFNGPSVDRAQAYAPDFTPVGDRKIIYISLGSINTDYANFYKMCIAAFQDSAYYVFMSIGKKCPADSLGDIPENFTVAAFMPQLDILKRADVFITHAGFNSVNEALYYAVPMLALPQVNDQQMVAGRVASLGLGVKASMKELTPETLREMTQALMADEDIHRECRAFSEEMHKARINDTVQRLEEYACERKA